MGNLYIRMRSPGGGQRWQLVSTGASGPPAGAPGLLKLRQYDGTWTQHLSPGDPNADVVRLRTGRGWEPVMYMGQMNAPTRLLQVWDWAGNFRNPHFQIIREFGDIEDRGAPGWTVTHVDRIRRLAGSFTPDELPAVPTAYSQKTSQYMSGLLVEDGYKEFTEYAVAHTSVDLDLIKYNLPAGSRVARVVITIDIGLQAAADGDYSDGISERSEFPYGNYNAYLFDTTGQDNPPFDVQFIRGEFMGYDRWYEGYPEVWQWTKPGSTLHGVEGGFIVSGRHLGTFNFGADTHWYIGGWGVGNYRQGSYGDSWSGGHPNLRRTVTLDYDDFQNMSHIDFGIFVEEVPMGKGTPANIVDVDTGRPIPSVNYVRAGIDGLTVQVFEYEPPPPDPDPQPSPG